MTTLAIVHPTPAPWWISPAYAWLWLFIEVNILWIGYDLWAKHYKHHTLSRQMHDWIVSPTIGPWVIASIAFIFVLLVMHFIRYHVALAG
jgi:hypothetical protein